MPQKYRVLSREGIRLNSKLLTEKKAKKLVDQGVVVYRKQTGSGSYSIQFTDPQAEKEFISMIEKTKKLKQQEKELKHQFPEGFEQETPIHIGRGWNHKKGMSKNAVTAYSEGKVPISRVTRKTLDKHRINIFVREAKDILLSVIGSCEYHHTSKYRHRTDFYDLNKLRKYLKKNENETDEHDKSQEH